MANIYIGTPNFHTGVVDGAEREYSLFDANPELRWIDRDVICVASSFSGIAKDLWEKRHPDRTDFLLLSRSTPDPLRGGCVRFVETYCNLLNKERSEFETYPFPLSEIAVAPPTPTSPGGTTPPTTTTTTTTNTVTTISSYVAEIHDEDFFPGNYSTAQVTQNLPRNWYNLQISAIEVPVYNDSGALRANIVKLRATWSNKVKISIGTNRIMDYVPEWTPSVPFANTGIVTTTTGGGTGGTGGTTVVTEGPSTALVGEYENRTSRVAVKYFYTQNPGTIEIIKKDVPGGVLEASVLRAYKGYFWERRTRYTA
jgi:hypothetical protein